MSLLFSVYVNGFKDLPKLSHDLIIGSKKIAEKVAGEIKSGFISLLNSISNSFISLQKMFSFSGVESKFYNDDRGSLYQAEPSSAKVENVTENTVENTRSQNIGRDEFNKMKSEMHAKLNYCFNKKQAN
ncbi:hypothetical protein [uncultured Cedecea sp.]|uniref:hypothetical protein n=1 Tax=uncultured Cedecea sp. TaxID=988762 RepID=UPI00262416AE|nr:hypothetical protein [uncultured Cedecea sp.]